MVIPTYVLILGFLLILSFYINIILLKKLFLLQHKKHSQSVRYGKLSEQFFPFLKKYPFDSSNFRFIGNPIDGVQFDDDKIVLVEFKFGGSGLTKRQGRIKELVDSGKVEFRVFRISDDRISDKD